MRANYECIKTHTVSSRKKSRNKAYAPKLKCVTEHMRYGKFDSLFLKTSPPLLNFKRTKKLLTFINAYAKINGINEKEI